MAKKKKKACNHRFVQCRMKANAKSGVVVCADCGEELPGFTVQVQPSKAEEEKVSSATGLNEQMEEFCRQFIAPHTSLIYKKLIDDDKPFNATRAAIRAGYSEKSAGQIAHKLLKRDEILQFIACLQKPALEKYEVSRDKVVEKLNRLAMANIADFIHRDEETGQAWIDITKCTDEQLMTLGSFKVKELPPFKYIEDGEEVVRDVIATEIKMKDDWKPLEALLKLHSIIDNDTVDVNVSTSVDAENTEEIARRVAFMLRSAVHDKDVKKVAVDRSNAEANNPQDEQSTGKEKEASD